jgi:hypothetical protein
MMKAFLDTAQSSTPQAASSADVANGKHQMQSQLMKEIMPIDRSCALVTMKAWAKFVEVGSSRQHNKIFTTMAEYLPYRIMDVGEM